jgi:formylglycine-generating enzyme required for sulfatase activity
MRRPLPKSIQPLARRHAVGLRPERFKGDCQRLVTALGEHLAALEVKRAARSDAERAAAKVEQKGRGAEEAARIAAAEERAQSRSVAGLSSAVIRRAEALKPGETFNDGDNCPEMVVVPEGAFSMGSNDAGDEKPPHRVTIQQPFAVGKFAVTFDEWDACAEAGGCSRYRPDDLGWGRGRRPVINVSWDDAKAYVAWLSAKTGQTFRLLSEAELECAARVGSVTKYPWGDVIGKGNANCRDSGNQWGGKQTAPVGSFPPNPWGLYDMHGNVWEWVEDPYHDTYAGAPVDGSVWTSGRSYSRVLRGGSWYALADVLRSANRSFGSPDYRNNAVGFRVAKTL